MRFLSLKNMLVVISIFVFVCIVTLLVFVFQSNIGALTLSTKIVVISKGITTLFIYTVVWVLIVFFRLNMRAQQFFFILSLLAASMLPLASTFYDISTTLLASREFLFFAKLFSYFYIVMLLFLFFSALLFHYNLNSYEFVMLISAVIFTAVIIQTGPLVLSTSTLVKHYFIGGSRFFLILSSVFSLLVVFLYLFGLLNFEVKKVVAYIQTLLLTGILLSFNLIIFVTASPYALLFTELFYIVFLLNYLHGYFYHAL